MVWYGIRQFIMHDCRKCL